MNIRIHSVLSGGAVDGPGLRTVIFTQGCPLACKYCHNRDTWSASGGKSVSVDELVEIAIANKSYYGRRGGVTVSGGEPLLQVEAVTELCRRLKEHGLHVCLDTAGSVISDKTEELLRYVDLVLLDVKHSIHEGFENVCGGNLKSTLDFLELIRKNRIKFWIRQVLVEGYTDSKTQIDGLLEIAGYDGEKHSEDYYPERIELLPYHGRGEEKWNKVGVAYPLKGMPDFDLKKADALAQYVSKKSIKL